MQERIKELAFGSGFRLTEFYQSNTDISVEGSGEALTRFAQAVARECMQVCRTVKGEASECSDGEMRYFEPDPEDYAQAIRARFGLEG